MNIDTIKDLSIIKTLRMNLCCLPFKNAIKLPIFVSRHTLLNKIKGDIEISQPVCTGMIRIGFGYVPIFDKYKSRTVWNCEGSITFKGKCDIGHGSKIGVGGNLIIGDNFGISAESIIICENRIDIGKDVLISWGCQIMDTDYHKVSINGITKNSTAPIKLGNHIWIGSNVLLLKGSVIADNTVVAAGSIVTKSFTQKNVLLAGSPATIIKEGVIWTK